MGHQVSVKARLSAYETMISGKRAREGDGRLGSDHNRRARSFVLVQYQDKVVRFLPLKVWPSQVKVSHVTLRSWLKRGVITAQDMYGMPVMCRAELAAVSKVVNLWWNRVDMHKATDPAFIRDLSDAVQSVRLALDTFKRCRDLTPHQRSLIEGSLEEPCHASRQ